jgi:transcription elongation factor GreA
MLTMTKQIRLTQTGLDELKQELSHLKVQRLAVADKLKSAKELGDLSENSDWASAQDEYKFIENRIDEVEHILRNAKLIKPARGSKEVQLGSTVTVQNNGKKLTYSLVGSLESDPEKGKISDESLVGKALIGKQVGDTLDIKAPSGKTTYKIVKIS